MLSSRPGEHKNEAIVTRKPFLTAFLLLLPAAAAVADPPGLKTLPIGSAAPDFQLPGVDGKTYSLADFAAAKVLVVIFTCNHCPTAQAYEGRIARLQADYRDKGVAVVAISPNDPAAVRLDELGYTDLGDSFEDMKVRAKDHNYTYPYLYDGETQATAKAYGVLATPHVYIFDAERKLRYVGRFDDGEVKAVKSHDAKNAVDALLAGKPVPVATTRVFGCSTKWADKAGRRPEITGEVGRRAGHARTHRPGRRRQARQERHQEALAREPLGDLVRPVRRRAARAGHDEPDVSRAKLSARHHQPGRPRQAGRRRKSAQGEPRRGNQLHPEARTTATSSPRHSTRNGPARSPTPS